MCFKLLILTFSLFSIMTFIVLPSFLLNYGIKASFYIILHKGFILKHKQQKHIFSLFFSNVAFEYSYLRLIMRILFLGQYQSVESVKNSQVNSLYNSRFSALTFLILTSYTLWHRLSQLLSEALSINFILN